jgi:citrate synthase
MKVFWRPDELTEAEAKLLKLCLEAHAESAMRANISTVLLQNAAQGSQDYAKAIAAALMGIGGVHAPLIDTWRVLQSNLDQIKPAIEAGLKIPGWGNSFVKSEHDPIWKQFRDHLRTEFDAISETIEKITDALHALGRDVYPNPSCCTAATGIALKMPPHLLPWLFIQGRLNTWSLLFCQSIGLMKGTV